MDQIPLAIFFNRMTGPLKLLLCSNTYNSKWILVKLTSHLWQITFTNPQAEKLSWLLLTKSLFNPARDLVVTLMIISDNFLENNPFPVESPQSYFYHVNDYLWHIISYGIHFLTLQRVSSRLPSKSIISLSKSPIEFPGCHINNITLTISSKWFPKKIPNFP